VTLQGSQGKLDKEEEMKYRMSQGRPHLFTDMRIVNDEGNEMPRDGKATGELQVRGPHVVKAYFRVRFPTWGSLCVCTNLTSIRALFISEPAQHNKLLHFESGDFAPERTQHHLYIAVVCLLLLDCRYLILVYLMLGVNACCPSRTSAFPLTDSYMYPVCCL